VTRAVVFDLWDTLVDFDPVAGRAFQDQVAVRLGRDPDEFAALWFEGRAKRESGTLRGGAAVGRGA
jgi:FMN phosphatase YigB (HAD superfamily)